MKISVIGAGPSGSYLAYLLAKKGFDVCIFEEHSEIGKPVHCTGLLTKEIKQFFKLEELPIINKFETISLYSKNNSVRIKTKDFVVNRHRLDKFIAEKAKQEGVNIYLNHSFVGFEGNIIKVNTNSGIKEFETDLLIGADGSSSNIFSLLNPKIKRDYYIGIQALVEGNFDKTNYDVYFNRDLTEFFSWLVPLSKKHAFLGLLAKKNANSAFNKFLNNFNFKLISKFSGLVPIYKKIKVQRNNVYLVGDAALHVKATTGGGIIPSLKAAKILAYCIANNKNYNARIKRLNRELWIHKKLRKALNKFSNKDYDLLLAMINKHKVKHILETTSRDNVFELALRLFFANPSFIRFLPKFF